MLHENDFLTGETYTKMTSKEDKQAYFKTANEWAYKYAEAPLYNFHKNATIIVQRWYRQNDKNEYLLEDLCKLIVKFCSAVKI